MAIFFAELRHHLLGEVGFSHRHAARSHHGVGVRRGPAEGGFELFRVVAHYSQVDHFAAQAREHAP